VTGAGICESKMIYADQNFFRFSYVAFVSFWTILVVELIGDRSLYMLASFALRFPIVLIICGMFAVFSIKMFVAVWLAQFLNFLPDNYSAIVTALIFFLSAILIWFKSGKDKPNDSRLEKNTTVNLLLPFLSLFFCEWIDAGQISAAALTSQFKLPSATWLGGVTALMCKGILALLIGITLRDRIPDRFLRIVAVSSIVIIGIISVIGIFQ
jgi:putative Ca2+/H+ antiporter (TMEM165/GDT1 family)